MKLGIPLLVGAVGLVTVAMLTTAGWDRPPITAEQHGFRGVAMELVHNPRTVAREAPRHALPEELFPWEEFLEFGLPYYPDNVDEFAILAGDFYENVQILGHLTTEQFNRLMDQLTEWVSPEDAGYGGCAYCHDENNLADDSMYTHQVSRRMFEMTWTINMDWQTHVGDTGVTCYTCHRGEPAPEHIWFTAQVGPSGLVGGTGEMSLVSQAGVLSSLPIDPFTPFLLDDNEIRVIQNENSLPIHGRGRNADGEYVSINDTRWTYSLMMHMSDSMGQNCTFCHNSRNFASWTQAPPQRYTAWYGIRMTRLLNVDYLEPLRPVYPDERLAELGSVLGDAPKANCATCHYGVNLPLNGAPMLESFPSLRSAPRDGLQALAQ
ncbi:MAG: photosynthetic reaction center cytochrome c subunit [Geminicoccaceae bacterium]|nr:MAG: photosynthetic reaction center cytochrome c subunit [Geminicoccaceae bacterium]